MAGQDTRDDLHYIFHAWHERARTRDVDGLLALYAEDAMFESPLVPAILDDRPTGVLVGKKEIWRLLDEGTKRRPNRLVRWYRDGRSFTDERTLIWEYPRQTPDGNQVDILEVMEIENGLIAKHRIYWGWFGTNLLIQNAVQKVIGGAGSQSTARARE